MSRVRQVALALAVVTFVGAAPVGAAAGGAPSLTVVPSTFSPATGALAVSASVGSAQPLGLQLASADGRPLGWISAPERRQLLSVFWDGLLDGTPVPDGRYRVRLVGGGDVIASARLTLDGRTPALTGIEADNEGTPFDGDGPLLTTISPNGDGFRDRAAVRFRLSEPAVVTLEAARTVQALGPPVSTETRSLPAGQHTWFWTPAAALLPRTYVLRLIVRDAAGNRSEYGALSARVGRYPRAPVVRVQGVDASFERASYAPGELARLRVASDADSLAVQFFRSGPEHVQTGSDNVMNGVPVSGTVEVGWANRIHAPATIQLGIGPWPSGLYFARLTSSDGRVGYAPFVLRPPRLGTSRVAIVLPTTTWQAYNFYDENGDGWGDTWYAGAPHQTVRLGRPFLRRGVIPFFRRYDLGFLHWLAWEKKDVDYLADSDLAFVPDGDALAGAYDLVIFPGHTEYVTEHLFDVVERYRDAGGNLAFLSANNLFWRIASERGVLRRAGLWRTLGRPESALIGVQYIGNDQGSRQGPFVVRALGAAWLWDRTGLEAGGTFGEFVGGYGIEIDAVTPASPQGIEVLAELPDLFGPGKTGQMTYYETPAGAKVFAAGALDFGGSATFWPVSRMLDNLWARLSVP